jgi:hypothetical protein
MNVCKICSLSLAAILLAACSAEIRVREINQDEIKRGDPINGVPFRKRTRYRIEVYQLGSEGKYVLVEDVKDNIQTLPDPNKLYVLQFYGSVLANANPIVDLHGDSTLKQVQLTTDSQGDELLTAAGEQAKAISDARDAKETAKEAERTADETALVAYYDAKIAAEQAQADFDELETKTEAEKSKLELAKVKANIAAKHAGEPKPYPDVRG